MRSIKMNFDADFQVKLYKYLAVMYIFKVSFIRPLSMQVAVGTKFVADLF